MFAVYMGSNRVKSNKIDCNDWATRKEIYLIYLNWCTFAAGSYCVRGLFGKLLAYSTGNIKQSNYNDESAQSTCCGPSLWAGRETFYPYCSLWLAQIASVISNACPFKIYCTIAGPQFLWQHRFQSFLVLLRKINHHIPFTGKNCLLTCCCNWLVL